MLKPTPKLRFIEREIGFKRPDGYTCVVTTQKILQCWHEEYVWGHDQDVLINAQWIDVPTEKE
jgi:hypothetical protein